MELAFSLRGHSSPVTALSIANLELFSGDENGNIIIWDILKRRPIHFWKAHTDSILQVAYHEQLNFHLTQGRDNTLRCWSNEVQTKVFSVDSLHFCKFKLYKTLIIYVDPSQTICVYDLQTEKFIATYKCDSHGGILCLEFDGQIVVAGFEDGSIGFFSDQIQKNFPISKEPILTCSLYKSAFCFGGAENILFIAAINQSELNILKKIDLNAGIAVVESFDEFIVAGCWNARFIMVYLVLYWSKEQNQLLYITNTAKASDL
jgi:WD40 repeat protein